MVKDGNIQDIRGNDGMTNSQSSKLFLDGHGSYLGMEKGCFIVRDKDDKVERYPLFEKEINEVVLKSGNCVSTGALASLGFWDIDVMVMTQRGRPVAIMKSLDDDSHVKTRLCQYEAYKNKKGVSIARQFVVSKLQGQNLVLKKYGLRNHGFSYKEKIENLEGESLDKIRAKLHGIEGKYSKQYFDQIFGLLPEPIRPESRKNFQAYDGTNNIFNLGYEVLSWKIHKALIEAKLEPYLGFLHSIQHGKPSLVCDFMELYRYLIDDFILDFCRGLRAKDFVVKSEVANRNKRGKREYLCNRLTRVFLNVLEGLFDSKVNIPRIKVGNKQTVNTLIGEEVLLFAKYLRNEVKHWIPRLCAI
jgi:CRISPR-associated protein Cas1